MGGTAGKRRIAVAAALVVGAAALAFAEGAGAAQAVVSGPARTVDGDTLEVAGVKVRLWGVDAPEMGQICRAPAGDAFDCGAASRAALRRMVSAERVRCEALGEDRYGRMLAVCRASGRDLGGALVAQGWALAFRRYADAYAAEEAASRGGRAGMWAGRFAAPWDHRAARRTAAPARVARVGARDCAIKGNVSRNGRIYHVPGSRWYARTRIDAAAGERWFCSEAEALAAGWRAPR